MSMEAYKKLINGFDAYQPVDYAEIKAAEREILAYCSYEFPAMHVYLMGQKFFHVSPQGAVEIKKAGGYIYACTAGNATDLGDGCGCPNCNGWGCCECSHTGGY